MIQVVTVVVVIEMTDTLNRWHLTCEWFRGGVSVEIDMAIKNCLIGEMQSSQFSAVNPTNYVSN